MFASCQHGRGSSQRRREGFYFSVARKDTANLPTDIVRFTGFDSSTILIQRGGILRYIGDFRESLSHAMLVGTMLVGRLGVLRMAFVRRSTPSGFPGNAEGSRVTQQHNRKYASLKCSGSSLTLGNPRAFEAHEHAVRVLHEHIVSQEKKPVPVCIISYVI